MLLEFYAPWCGHCKALKEPYEKAAQALKGFEPAVRFAKIDATAEIEIAGKHEVQGFPTLKWCVEGECSDYSGGRTEADLVTWVKRKAGPPATVLADAAAVTAFAEKEGDAVAVGFFPPGDSPARDAFVAIARSADSVPFGEAPAGAGAAFGLPAGGGAGVVMLTKFDEKQYVYDGDVADRDALRAFVNTKSIPLVVKFSQETAPKIFGGAIDRHVLLFHDVDGDAFKALADALKPTAKGFLGEYVFVAIDKSEDRVLQFFDLKKDDTPALRIVKMGDGAVQKFVYDGELAPGPIAAFVEQHKAGELTPHLKTQDVPEGWDAGNVLVLVGSNFDSVAADPAKDVLVEFYAPWCGHCKKLAPVYEQLGEKLAALDTVVVAKMDATENELADVAISGFPTLKFWPAWTADQVASGAKPDAVDMEGDRDLDGLVAFLQQECRSENCSDDIAAAVKQADGDHDEL